MLDKELRELALKHFPAAQAGALKQFIDQAEHDKALLDLTKDSLTKANETIHSLRQYKDVESEQKAKENELIAREKAIREIEVNLEIVKLKYQLEAIRESKNEIFRLVETLVKNPRSFEIMTHTENVPLKNQYGGVDYHGKYEQKKTEKLDSKDEPL